MYVWLLLGLRKATCSCDTWSHPACRIFVSEIDWYIYIYLMSRRDMKVNNIYETIDYLPVVEHVTADILYQLCSYPVQHPAYCRIQRFFYFYYIRFLLEGGKLLAIYRLRDLLHILLVQILKSNSNAIQPKRRRKDQKFCNFYIIEPNLL